MEVFVQRRGVDVELHEAAPNISVAAFAEAVGLPGEEVWLEEADEPLATDVTLAAAGVTERANVHIGRCKKVQASVRFEAPTKEYDVHPAATLHRIYDKATSKREGFDFSAHDKGQYTLQVRGTTEQPDLSRHVGVFVDGECRAAFDLVLQKRFQGA
jgi:hypothetical protein